MYKFDDVDLERKREKWKRRKITEKKSSFSLYSYQNKFEESEG